MATKSMKEEFPLHWLVWHNLFRELDAELEKEKVNWNSSAFHQNLKLNLKINIKSSVRNQPVFS